MSSISRLTLKQLSSPNREKMENAFNLVYKEYSFLVYFVSLKIVKDKQTAEDITNEVFMKLYENIKNINSEKNLKYYLTTISKNLSINYLKSNSKITFNDDEFECKENDDYKEFLNQFEQFLDEEEIEIIIGHLIYGFTFKSIGIQLNKNVDQISSKYFRTMKKVKEFYGVK